MHDDRTGIQGTGDFFTPSAKMNVASIDVQSVSHDVTRRTHCMPDYPCRQLHSTNQSNIISVALAETSARNRHPAREQGHPALASGADPMNRQIPGCVTSC